MVTGGTLEVTAWKTNLKTGKYIQNTAARKLRDDAFRFTRAVVVGGSAIAEKLDGGKALHSEFLTSVPAQSI